MNNITLFTLFFLKKNRMNKIGLCPIICRITYETKRKDFSTGQFISPDHWIPDILKVNKFHEQANQINTQLSLIESKLNQAFLLLQVKEEHFTVEQIYRIYSGVPKLEEAKVLQSFQAHNERLLQLVGIDYSIGTYAKFRQAYNHLESYIKRQYKRKDYPFKELNLKFLKDYEFFLRSKQKLSTYTTFKVIQRFRKIIKIAIAEDVLDKDPFILYKAKKSKKTITYLTPEELKLLEEFTTPIEKLQKVKDMFIFCCYTGLAFNEMTELNTSHIVKGFDDKLWIKMKRKKTQKELSIPLLNPSLKIIHKYEDCHPYILPKISNQKFNAYIKEVASLAGIDKWLTHHMARRTFATTVLLYNDVPMEIVSKLLGHSKISITEESYGKIVQKKISEHMKRLGWVLNT